MARVISGIGGNVFATGTTYLIRVSDESDRSSLTSKVLIFCYMGLLCGPALNYPLSLLGQYRFGVFSIGPLNSPGFLMVFLLSCAIALVHLWFEEPVTHAEEEEDLRRWLQLPQVGARVCGCRSCSTLSRIGVVVDSAGTSPCSAASRSCQSLSLPWWCR